jgi:hypothetical protein
MNKAYIVRLTDDERHALLQLTKSGKAAASQIKRAHILTWLPTAPPGLMRTSPPPCTVMPRRCAMFVNALANKASRPLWSAQHRSSPHASAS